MGTATVETADLRAEDFDSLVKGFALQSFKMKQLVTIKTANAWIETYYRETAAELTAQTGASIKTSRLSHPAYLEASWQKFSSTIDKYFAEGAVSYEDATTANIPVIARETLRISRAIAYAIDTAIYAALLANKGGTVTITAGYEWGVSNPIANRDPIQDILNAKKLLYDNNYDPDNGNTFLVINQAEYALLLGNSKVVNNPSFKGADVVANGIVGQICGLKVLVSPVVTTDTGSLVVIGQECATWQSAMPLTVFTIEDKGVKTTIRALEMGVLQVTSPNCIINITNTYAA